ncbi:Quinone oxidoreductase 2 [Arthrobacter saudimassiliensis]|uniref:Quinone oxidoreductase 2 n=1 Tax=Arthrobacter saudimassiliensis TaxID=1461584 RepID=A0A078MKQ9_9MICC|nr:Quinone oxidoreductase 2 [Arthrobacter saudimassiliensis]
MAQNLPALAVTGATGALGGAVARLLAEAGVGHRLLARHPARLPSLPDVPVYAVTYADRPAAEKALRGVEVLFMVSVEEHPRRWEEQRTFVDAAAEAGVRHIVYTSFMAAAPDAVFTLARDHWDTEEYIRGHRITHTFLRNCLYQDVLPGFAGPDGVIRGPAGEGRLAAVARADVARAAARILARPEDHRDRTYTLTGPQALNFSEIAAILTRVTGSRVSYHNETLPEAIESRQAAGASPWQAEAWASTYAAVAAGQLSSVSQDVEQLTGTPPIRLERYLLQ